MMLEWAESGADAAAAADDNDDDHNLLGNVRAAKVSSDTSISLSV